MVREAAVATEDERFYQHSGVDLIALLRAVPFDVSHLSFAQGASTIAEQLAKVVYLGGNDHSVLRKTQEVVLGYRASVTGIATRRFSMRISTSSISARGNTASQTRHATTSAVTRRTSA